METLAQSSAPAPKALAPAPPQIPRPGPSAEDDERLALLLIVLGKSSVDRLLEGIEPERRSGIADRALSLRLASSSHRQTRLAALMGPRADADERLRLLWRELPAPLRPVLQARLPAYRRALLPEGAPSVTPSTTSPLLGAWLDRLILEASR